MKKECRPFALRPCGAFARARGPRGWDSARPIWAAQGLMAGVWLSACAHLLIYIPLGAYIALYVALAARGARSGPRRSSPF